MDVEQAAQADPANLAKIEELLKTKNDTQRFVGLALLRSVLDNSADLRQNAAIIQHFWSCISSKFLDRLLKTGSKPSNPDAKDMLDLAVSILHTFAILLPAAGKGQSKLADRVPSLVDAVLYSSGETTDRLLQTLFTVVSNREGAEALILHEDISSLTEIAPSHAIVLDILRHAWLNGLAASSEKHVVSQHVDKVLQNLCVIFKGTDAVTLLSFLGAFLPQADLRTLPKNPKWLPAMVGFIQNLVKSRPTADARAAYTNASAALLQSYPQDTMALLFVNTEKEEKPFTFLFINLLLIDIRSSAPTLLEKLNDPTYPAISRRLASAFDVVCIFLGFLIRSLEDESLEALVMPPDSLLKMRKNLGETMSVTVEYLRDRWDASVAGAMGLHPDARTGNAETSMGSHKTLTWDSMKDIADKDPFILSALRTLAIWLREDENETLRKEATGLTDVFLELYQASDAGELDFRSPTLVALEGLLTFKKGREMFLLHDGWTIISKDLMKILRTHAEVESEGNAELVIDMVRVLLTVTEEEESGTLESWLDLITAVAAWDVPDSVTLAKAREAHVAVLQLCCTLLTRANSGMRSRYRHSIAAIAGAATHVAKNIQAADDLNEQMTDVLDTLRALS